MAQRDGLQVTAKELPEIPLPSIKVRDPLTLVIFGATGDLSLRKLIPALFVMFRQGLMPDKFAVIGMGRRGYDDESYRAWMADTIREFSRVEADSNTVTDFCSHLHYHDGDITTEQTSIALRDRLRDMTLFPSNHLFYLSIKPEYFECVTEHLSNAGLIKGPYGDEWSRVVIEKPFGRDLKSGTELNRHVLAHMHESQVYRIDHYLGKETVQNILSFRLANAIFEPVFNNKFVDHVQITAAETVGMESGRGAYYDATGALRDMVQNHLLQLLCLVAMEPPADLTAEAIHNEKVKVLHSVTPFTPESAGNATVRAQYVEGNVNGETVPGYRSEDRVNPDSQTESFVAARLSVENWRWAGVPFYLRTGKRMAKRVTEIAVQFKVPPLQLFNTVECVGDVCDLTRSKPNILAFRIQPEEAISLSFSAKRPGLQVQVENVDMDFSYAETWHKDLPEAYERLLLDVMRGDSTLFTRSDEVESAWRIVDSILNGWVESSPPVCEYSAGSWGPKEADSLFKDCDASAWRRPA
ncbi:MAG: glucose-6-phosphate dehydrogenase [Verrucomicrobia bacterium]|nr:glucose-6-phosphate dehydrogenase [Verrucomicrobiota bacterium]